MNQLDQSGHSEGSQRNKAQTMDFSFLNLHALNQSFLEKSSSSKDSSSRESFDMSSDSNPYGSSSESEEEIQEVDEHNENQIKLQTNHASEKSNKGVNILLSLYLAKENEFPDLYENTTKLIKRVNLSKFDLLIFYVAACVRDREDDVPILFEKLKVEFFNKQENEDDTILNQMIYSIVEESANSDKGKACTVFIEHSAYFLQRVLEDKQQFYELFQAIIQSGELNKFQLLQKLYIQTTTLSRILLEKKYDPILFLIKNNVRIIHTQMISFVHSDDISYEGYLNKPLFKVNLKLVAIFYTEKMKDANIIKKLLFEIRQTSQEYQELLKVFIRFRLNSLAKETFRALTDCDYLFDTKILNFTLAVENFEILWFLANHESVPIGQWLNEEKTQKMLVDLLYTSEGKNFEYILYYLKRVKRLKSKLTIKRLSENLISRLHSCKHGQFLYTFYNPLKIGLLVVELMQQTILTVMHHKNRLSKVLELYYKFSQIYISLITDDSQVIELLKDTDLERRKVLYLIDTNKSAIIQATQSVEDAIESMWNGSIAPKTSLLKMFTVTQNLFFEELSDYIIEMDPNKNDIFMALNTNFYSHHFSLQRVVWTYNCRIRNQIDQCLMLILMLAIFINFFFMYDPQLQIQQLLATSSYRYSTIVDQELELIEELKAQYLKFQIYLDIIIGFNFTFKPLFIAYYDWTQSVQTKFNAQDFTGFTLGLFSLFQWGFILNAEQVSEPYRFDIIISFRWIYITITMLQTMQSIRNFKVFGPMIKALWLVVLECSKLIFIFILVHLLFGFMAYFSFYENSNQRLKTLGQSLLYLVEALFGQFSFAEFSEPSALFAPIFLNIYLFFSPIIFMQLIVAVLTFTFETASRSGRVHYYIGMIQNIRNLDYDAVCGCLVALPIVGSVFNIIFILSHMLSDPDPALKESNMDFLKKVNRALVKGAYFPIYIVLTLVSLTLVILFSPVFYIVKLFRILKEISHNQGYSKSKRFFKWLAFGFVYMTIQTIKDFRKNYQYLMHGKFVNDSPQLNISNIAYAAVASTSRDLYLKQRDKQNKIPLADFLFAVVKKIRFMESKASEKAQKQEQFTQPLTSQDNIINTQLSASNTLLKEKGTELEPASSTKNGKKYEDNSNKIQNEAKETLESGKDTKSDQKSTNKQQHFANRIRSLLSPGEESEEEHSSQSKQKKVEIKADNKQVPIGQLLKPIQVEYEQETDNTKKTKQPRRSILFEDEILVKRKGDNKIQVEMIGGYSQNQTPQSRSSLGDNQMLHQHQQSPSIHLSKKGVSIESEDSPKQIQFKNSHQRQQSSGSNTGRFSNKTTHTYQGGENPHRKKTKTTYQVWKKIRKEENSSSNSLIKESDNLYQFLDAFVVDEEDAAQEEAASNQFQGDKEENTYDYIYVESLLKLMYHYSKNDVKLARFNVLFQSIKKLFKED